MNFHQISYNYRDKSDTGVENMNKKLMPTYPFIFCLKGNNVVVKSPSDAFYFEQ